MEQLERMRSGRGFIAALDQSGGSTPKALKLYGLTENSYSNETEMFDLVHEMRTRIIKSPSLDWNQKFKDPNPMKFSVQRCARWLNWLIPLE